MSDSARRDASDPTQPIGSSYPDPAYASQVNYGAAPTQQYPSSPNVGTDPFAAQAPQSPLRRAPGWLWALAGLSVVLVLCLLIALVVINSNEQQTLVAPPPMPQPPHETTTAPRTSTPSAEPAPIPLPIPLPAPGSNPPDAAPPEAATPGETETVVYSVTGSGRAINITYIDNGNVLQTEFNVMLPWSKEVQLSAPSARSASLSIVNVGRPISCSISVEGVPVQHHTGMGLTVCTALNRGFRR
jgi:hypothetical protein